MTIYYILLFSLGFGIGSIFTTYIFSRSIDKMRVKLDQKTIDSLVTNIKKLS